MEGMKHIKLYCFIILLNWAFEHLKLVFAACTHSGVRYDHGARWRPAESPCDVCSCLVGFHHSCLLVSLFIWADPALLSQQEGRVHCEKEKCTPPCRSPAAPPPDSCCPVCQGGPSCPFCSRVQQTDEVQCVFLCFVGCDVNGHDFPNGAVIPSWDRCQECTCVVCLSEFMNHGFNTLINTPNEVYVWFNFLPEWKCDVFASPMSCLVLSQPCASCGRLLPTVTSILTSSVSLYSMILNVQMTKSHTFSCFFLLHLWFCRCEQCEYESEVYVNGAKFSSKTDPCLQCLCSVSGKKFLS